MEELVEASRELCSSIKHRCPGAMHRNTKDENSRGNLTESRRTSREFHLVCIWGFTEMEGCNINPSTPNSILDVKEAPQFNTATCASHTAKKQNCEAFTNTPRASAASVGRSDGLTDSLTRVLHTWGFMSFLFGFSAGCCSSRVLKTQLVLPVDPQARFRGLGHRVLKGQNKNKVYTAWGSRF